MQIKRLRIAGFKSFVDPCELRIEPGLTGVVGPNGCGKSNLLEALRWTMGEGSAKSLRGAGMDDVIFAGTATRPPRDVAEVSILADLPGADGPEEREVVRRIERGAGSAYRIDGHDVRARDVALLFADAATGAHSPALVSQGRIGAVIAARPADRRAMLEEAAGIAGLHVRRKEAETRLRATEVNLERLGEVIAEQDARAAALRRQARAAERYRGVSQAIRLAEARMIFARWRDAAAAADAAKQEASAAEAAVGAATEAERGAAGYAQAAAQALATARAAALSARDRASEAGHRLAGVRRDLAAAERRLAELAEACRRIDEGRAREGSLAHDAADALTRLADETRLLEAAVAEAIAALPGVGTAQGAAERAARDAEVALAQALARQASDTADARVVAAALAAARLRTERAARVAASLTGDRAALGEATPLTDARDDAARQRATATASADAASVALAGADADERRAIAARDEAERHRAAARAELSALDGEAAALASATRQRGDDAQVIDHVTPAPGYERALAAALDDALMTPLDAWAGAAPIGTDPSPPAGTAPLAGFVRAPAALARRLAQVFVTDEDAGQPLAVGQRLVTRAGALRRWDGYYASGSGAATAERLERLNRLDALAAERPARAEKLAEAEEAHRAADAGIGALRAAATAARAIVLTAETEARRQQQAEDRATLALDRLAAQYADLDARRARAAGEAAEAATELAQAEAASTALPDDSAGAAAVAHLSDTADHARTAVANLRGERTALDRRLAADRERIAAAETDANGWQARAGEAARRLADLNRREETAAAEATALADRPTALAAEIIAQEAEHAAADAAAGALATDETNAEAALRRTEAILRAASEALSTAREARAGAAARLDHAELRRVEMGRLSGERFACPAPLLPGNAGFGTAAVGLPADESAAHDRLVAERERIGPVNLVAAAELADLEAASTTSAAERDELGQAVNRLRGSIGTLNREGRQRLLAAFEAVDRHFRRLFATLFDGGSAHLELVDSDDPLEAGLEIMAQPPGKRLQSLTLLSGGEQALTAVALIFGLFLTNPAPICVLDEVDAPLDDANIERFCDLLDRMAADTATRYLIVTHNAVTMSRMHRLFGVTMIEKGVSRLVSVDLQAAAALVAE